MNPLKSSLSAVRVLGAGLGLGLCLSLSLSLAATFLTAPAAGASESSSCPAVVVVAARGSDENAKQNEHVGPQIYAEGGRQSNGFEGPTLSRLLHFAEQRHVEQAGQSLMRDVYVLGLDEKAYPAKMELPPLAQEGEQLSPMEIPARLLSILRQRPLGELVFSVTFGALDSLRAGQENAPGVVDAYERESGCTPRYIIVGYSQGAVIGTALERHLAATGRLIGVMYLGNPLLAPGAGGGRVIGAPSHGRGMVGGIPVPGIPRPVELDSGRRVNYCLRSDFVCDFDLPAAQDALSNKARRHASYFRGATAGAATADDAAVADTFATWVTGANGAIGATGIAGGTASGVSDVAHGADSGQ